MADTKIICGYNFVSLLKPAIFYLIPKIVKNLEEYLSYFQSFLSIFGGLRTILGNTEIPSNFQ